MAWVKLDCDIFVSTEFMLIGIDARMLYIASLFYLSTSQLDYIPSDELPQVAKLGAVDNPQDVAESLVKVGLWAVSEGKYEIGNWLNCKIGKDNSDKRKTPEYRRWRRAVLYRDGYACVSCNDTERLQAHHLKPWAKSISERFNVDNGATLCLKCHIKVHSAKRCR